MKIVCFLELRSNFCKKCQAYEEQLGGKDFQKFFQKFSFNNVAILKARNLWSSLYRNNRSINLQNIQISQF